MHLQDRDRTALSEKLVERFTAGGYFRMTGSSFSDGESIGELLSRNADLVLVIPHDFERDLTTTGHANVQLMINAEDGFSAGVIQAYASEIVGSFNREELSKSSGAVTLQSTPEIKLLPFWIIGLAEMSIGLLIAPLIFHVPMLGSYWLIYLVSAIYMLVVLGMGLLISTVTETQQQAMFVAWLFMVIFTMMSGLFTAIESMPHWAQTMTLVNLVRHFVDIMRRVMLKGSGLMEIRVQLLWLVGYAAVMVTLAVNRYRKVAE